MSGCALGVASVGRLLALPALRVLRWLGASLELRRELAARALELPADAPLRRIFVDARRAAARPRDLLGRARRPRVPAPPARARDLPGRVDPRASSAVSPEHFEAAVRCEDLAYEPAPVAASRPVPRVVSLSPTGRELRVAALADGPTELVLRELRGFDLRRLEAVGERVRVEGRADGVGFVGWVAARDLRDQSQVFARCYHLRASLAEALAACDPAAATERALRADRSLGPSVRVLAVGKAAAAMARGARAALPDAPLLVVTGEAYDRDVPAGASLALADHPLPSRRSVAAARAASAFARAATGGLVALISGGASALLARPVASLSLAGKRADQPPPAGRPRPRGRVRWAARLGRPRGDAHAPPVRGARPRRGPAGPRAHA